MSDQETRELERRFRASGSVADEVAWLTARARAGELSPERLDLLAQLGSQGARRVLGAEAPKPIRDVEAWLESILAQAPELGLRAALAVLRQLVPMWERQPERCELHGTLRCASKPCQPDPRLRAVLLPLTATILSGSPDAQLLETAMACQAAEEEARRDPPGGGSVRVAGRRWSAEDEAGFTYHRGSWKAHAAQAGFIAACAALALHGSVAQRVEIRPLIGHHVVSELLVSEGSRPVDPDHPEWERCWAMAALALSRRASTEGLPTLRATAREVAMARRIDPAYGIQEALEELRVAVRKELLPFIHGGEDPLRKRAAPEVRGGA